MTATQPTSADRIRQYLTRLSQQARSSLLTEIERMQLYGEDISAFAPILAELRAEFRKTGDGTQRIGNPSRYFFMPMEALFVDRPPEKANAGQISRGSLSPIWEWINRELLPTMARDYGEKIKDALVGGHAQRANQVAARFQSKVVTSLQSTLASEAGVKSAQRGLGKYTSSRACMDDLGKLLVVLQMRDAIATFSAALPEKIDRFEGEALKKAQAALDRFVAKHPQGVPFALNIIMKRLRRPWQVVLLAIGASHSRTAEDIAATRYALAVSMALDHLDDRNFLLKQALKTSRVDAAKDILADIYAIEYELRDRIDGFEKSDWGRRLEDFMTLLATELDAEFNSLPDGTRHVLAALAHRRHGGFMHHLAQMGHGAVASATTYYEKLVGSDHKQAG
jgi:hypothetical protein